MKYIDADKLIAEIERLTNQKKKQLKRFSAEDYTCSVAASISCELYGDEEVLSIINSLQQEQPEEDITEFEKALDNFGEAYATLVDRDNNPNQGIRINAYHELVKEEINKILSLAKEYVKQEKPEVDFEKLGGIARHLIAVKDHGEDMRLDEGEWLLLERIGYPERFNARKEE